MERVDKADKKRAEEKTQRQPVTFNTGPTLQVDYEKISDIVESIVSSKFAEYSKKLQLNENKQTGHTPFNGIKVIQLKENGSFLMLDTDDNIYECSLTYKGKNKKKRWT